MKMFDKLYNIKISKSVKGFMQGMALLGLAVLTLTAVTYKQQGVISKLNIVMSDENRELLVDKPYLQDLLVSELGSTLVGVPIEFVDIQELERLYRVDPFVKNAEVFINKRGVLEIQVEIRNPVLRIITPDESFYLDTQNSRVPLSDHYTARLPIMHVTAANEQHFNVEKRTNMVKLVNAMNEQPFIQALVDQIEVDGGGEYTARAILGNEKIKIGTTENIDDKLERIQLFYKKKIARGNWNQCAYIDVRFKGQIICGKN